jgi:hypothetical protein
MGRRYLIFSRPHSPTPEESVWLLIVLRFAAFACLTEHTLRIRRGIAAELRQSRREVRSMCAGCRFFPGDKTRRGERERRDGLRACLAGELMEFQVAARLSDDRELTGWRRPGCSRRQKGEAEPEPPLPPRPWFRFGRRKWGCEVTIEAVDGCWTSLNRELDFPRSIYEARIRAAAYARRNRIPFVEAEGSWR